MSKPREGTALKTTRMRPDCEWQAQAAILRRLAEYVTDPPEKDRLLELADECERVAALRVALLGRPPSVHVHH